MRLLHPLRLAAVLLALLPALHAAAADMPLSTDLLEPLDIVAAGRWQSELVVPSARSLRERLAGDDFAVPTLLRLGVGHSVELRSAIDAAAMPAGCRASRGWPTSRRAAARRPSAAATSARRCAPRPSGSCPPT